MHLDSQRLLGISHIADGSWTNLIIGLVRAIGYRAIRLARASLNEPDGGRRQACLSGRSPTTDMELRRDARSFVRMVAVDASSRTMRNDGASVHRVHATFEKGIDPALIEGIACETAAGIVHGSGSH